MPPPSASVAALSSGGPFASIFAPLGVALDATNATREALVKASRDVTIAAKKLIFVLHRLDVATLPTPAAPPLPLAGNPVGGPSPSSSSPPLPPPPPPPHPGLDAATDTAKALSRQVVTTIGSRLVSPADAVIHARAYSPGLQEYVEAVVFLAWLRTGGLASRDDVQRGLDAALEAVTADTAAAVAVPAAEAGAPAATPAGGRKPASPPTSPLTARRVVLSWDDYLLGVADVAGEVMRLAVAAGSNGSDAAVAVSHRAAALLQALTVAYEGLPAGAGGGIGGRDGAQKLSAMRASRAKVERALYTRVVRAAEFGEGVRGGGGATEGGDSAGAGGGGGGGGGAAGGDAGDAAAGGKGRGGRASGEGAGGGVKRPATTGASAAGGTSASAAGGTTAEGEGKGGGAAGAGAAGGGVAEGDGAGIVAASGGDVTAAPAPKKVRVA